MTDFFPYDELTWQEAADLPRDTPLVIPLGGGYEIERLADQLSHPPKIGLLPAIPYGWRGSGLMAAEDTFAAILANLLESVRDDGFTHVYALMPQGLDLGLGAQALHLPNKHLTSSEMGENLPGDEQRGKVILIPIGHTEQHAYHLPLSVDTVIIEAIAIGAATQSPTTCATLPVMPYGVSMHRYAYAATTTVGGRAFEDFWISIIDVLVGRGFDRFYFLSGHGGNMSFLVNIIKYVGERHLRIFCATAFLHTAGHLGAPAIEKHRQSKMGGMGHAGELETSFMLHLRPELCHMERVVDEIDFVTTPNYYMDWIEGGALAANPSWYDDTKTGSYGAGSLATAEKGRIWLEVAIQEKIDHVAEIHQQQEMREARRKEGFGMWRNYKLG